MATAIIVQKNLIYLKQLFIIDKSIYTDDCKT